MPVKKLIERIEVGAGGAASITFSAIPQTYTHLLVVCSLRTSTSNSDIGIKLNGLTTGFSNRYLIGNGSSASSGTALGNYLGSTSKSTDTANTFGSYSTYLPNYRSSVAKSISADSVRENNATASQQTISAVLWDNTAAVTSLTIYEIFGANLVEYSSVSLYGITRGSDGTTTVS